MDKVVVHSTSAQSAECSDILLRQTNATRLVFRPVLVANAKNPKAAVDGTFIFQRKGSKEEWADVKTIPFSSLKKDEGYKLELSSVEVLTLFEGLANLYELHKQEGIPHGNVQYVKVNRKLAQLAALPDSQLRQILIANDAVGMDLLSRLLKWATDSDDPHKLIARLINLGPANLRKLNVAVGLQSLKSAVATWQGNKGVATEEFWQKTLAENSFVLEHVFSWPMTIVKGKAYVGGKSVMNVGGHIVDFLVKNRITTNAALVEIKTPATELLGKEYRPGIFNPSEHLSGAIMQILNYKNSLEHDYFSLTAFEQNGFESFDPACVVIIGNASDELKTTTLRKSFELLRAQHRGVTVITFDELFGKTQQLIDVLEASDGPTLARQAEDDDMPF
jgi:hypothetical protein